MSLVTRDSAASMDLATGQLAPQVSGLVAGEALDIAAPCYIKSSDGKVYMSNATAANEAAEIIGFTARAVAAGQPVTLFGKGARFRYGSSLTPGAILYAAATAGRLDTAATVGDWQGVAEVVDDTDIRIVRDSILSKLTAAGMAHFISAEQTGTGSAQNVAHGLGVVPSVVLVVPTEHPGTPDTGAFDISEGTHTTTNVVVTVTANVKFKVLAFV
ncbi:MAG TPA: hypothetical protein VLH75_07300 [Longimicrobiales bacterium]|nr:hypothetical protein [Longimicrobiales bacterium]